MIRIIYLCPADNTPTGGVKVIYRHAELLTSLGADACVLHLYEPDFTCDWFEHNTKIARNNLMDVNADFVIIPEIWAATFGPQCIAMGIRFGIFVQNGYHTHQVLTEQTYDLFSSVYKAAQLVLTISDDSARMVMLNYPQIDPARIVPMQWSINDRFMADHRSTTAQGRMISFMPRKMATHATRVVYALKHYLPPSWGMVAIDNVSESTVATILSSSHIFLSFSEFEGCPLPPLEAALAGNLVIGYTGQGANEYWDSPNFIEVHQGDIRAFVTETIRAMKLIDAGVLTSEDLAPGVRRLRDRYSLAAEKERLRILHERIRATFHK